MAQNIRLIRLLKSAFTGTDWAKYRPANWDRMKILYPFRLMTHPIETSEEIKFSNRGSLAVANGIALLYFILRLLSESSTGFILNMNYGGKTNGWIVFLSTVGLILLWCVSSWSLSTLMNGEGKFKEIYILVCYSVLPDILLRVPLLLLTNVVVVEELGLVAIFETAITCWCFVLLFLSTMSVQQYTVGKTVAICVFSVIGIVAILFLGILLFSLFQQFYIFLRTVATEALFRI